jgi:hypothetical protein
MHNDSLIQDSNYVDEVLNMMMKSWTTIGMNLISLVEKGHKYTTNKTNHHKRAYFRIHENHISTRVPIKLNQAMAFFVQKKRLKAFHFFKKNGDTNGSKKECFNS